MQKVIALRQLWLFDIFVQCWVIILQICRVSFFMYSTLCRLRLSEDCLHKNNQLFHKVRYSLILYQ